MAAADPICTVTKGADHWRVTEQIRLSPLPKWGGPSGRHYRLLAVSRGQSILTDLEPGSLAQKRRCAGLPLLHRLWPHETGHCLGYTKKQKIGNPSELFFLDAEARLLSHRSLPDVISQVASAPGHWYVGCRDGAVYAFSLEGIPLWSQVVPCERRDRCNNAEFGLPLMQPYLHLTAGSFGLVTGAEMEMHLYDGLGHRGLCVPLPSTGSRAVYCHPLGLPTREERLRRLGWQQEKGNLRTGYLRLSLDSRLEGGWVKQAELCEAPAEPPAGLRREDGVDDLCLAMPWRSAGIHVLRSTWNSILVGTQDGFLHAFDGRGKLQRTFQVGEAAVTEILLDEGGLRAACCAGEITFFERGQISGSTVLPEYFVDLAGSGEFVLAWRWKSVWLLDQTGTVRWAAEVRRPIHSCWGNGGGFCLLAGQLLSLRRTHAV